MNKLVKTYLRKDGTLVKSYLKKLTNKNTVIVKGFKKIHVKTIAKWSDYLKVQRGNNREKYLASSGILSNLIETFKTSPESIRSLVNENGEINAVASFHNMKQDGYLMIGDLLADPRKLEDSSIAIGAGTTMVEKAVLESIELGHKGRVRLYPLDSAELFYTKIGFKKDISPSGFYDMVLEPEDAQVFLEKRKMAEFTKLPTLSILEKLASPAFAISTPVYLK